jgi:hypothetical protein
VTALAHQFAGLIGPLHGSYSADRAKDSPRQKSPRNGVASKSVGLAAVSGSKDHFQLANEPARATGPLRTVARLISDERVFVNRSRRAIPADRGAVCGLEATRFSISGGTSRGKAGSNGLCRQIMLVE